MSDKMLCPKADGSRTVNFILCYFHLRHCMYSYGLEVSTLGQITNLQLLYSCLFSESLNGCEEVWLRCIQQWWKPIFNTLFYGLSTLMLWVVIEVKISSAGVCSSNVYSSNLHLLCVILFCTQDPSATLMMFPSRSMKNFAAQLKWGCLLVSVCQSVALCEWRHRLVWYW